MIDVEPSRGGDVNYFLEQLELSLLLFQPARPTRCDVARHNVVGSDLYGRLEFIKRLLVIAFEGVLIASD